MKKIIIILTIFLLTACYDNKELSDLSIVTSIGIDYKDNNYLVSFEIMNDNKTDNTSELLSYTVNGEGKNISEAFNSTKYKVPKKSFFAHLKLLLISENIEDDKLKNIIDYLIRDVEIRDEYIILITTNVTPLEIQNHNSKIHPIMSNYIVGMVENERFNNGACFPNTFKEISANLISNNKDIILNSITLIDDTVSISKSYIFNGYNIKNVISEDYTSIYAMLNKKSKKTFFKKKYNNKDFIISITNANNKIDVSNDKIIFNVSMIADIVENNPNIDLKNRKNIKMIEKDFKNIISKEIESFIILLQKNNSDIFGFEEIYYKKYNKKNKKLWKSADVDIKVNINVSNTGFISEGDI